MDRNRNIQKQESGFEERVINVDRVARVVKGGRRFRFRVLVVVGDKHGQVGMGLAKAQDVTGAITKASAQAKKHLIHIPLENESTIAYDVYGKHAGGKVLLKPAGPGTGVIAGGAVRAVLEVAGISDILSKSLGSSNKVNTTYATLAALQQLVPAAEARR